MNSESKKLKIIVTGGGTGGHVYPAIAVAQKLHESDNVEKVYYIGCAANMEKDIAIREGFEFLPISISGMPRKLDLSTVKWFFELAGSIIQSLKYLIKIKPDAVFGTGGYVSGPAIIAACILKIPFIIHDSDAYPGIVSRFMAPYASAVFTAFESAKKHLKSKNIILNGNPIRSSLNLMSREEALASLGLSPEKNTIFVTGGSQGAATINEAMLEAVPKLINDYNFQVIHQTGKKNFDEYSKKIPNYREYIVRPYFDNMAVPYAAANLAIARAGSLSISELNLCGLPAILVPYPYAAADHQRFNAIAMQDTGAAILLENSECTGNNIINLILELFNNKERLLQMGEISKSLTKPHSVDNIINYLEKI